MRIYLFIAFVLVTVSVQAQNEVPAITSNDMVYSTAVLDEKPEYPGKLEGFYSYIGHNFKMPSVKGLSGKIYVTFVVEKDGSLNEITVIRELGYGTGAEAVRILKACPKWKPGKLNGQPVRVRYSLPIEIS